MSVIGLSGRVEERGGEKEGYIPDIIVVKQSLCYKEFTKQT